MSPIQLKHPAWYPDTPGHKRITTIFQDLVNGIVEPQNAAETIDEIIVGDCQEAYLSYASVVPKPTAQQTISGAVRTPCPSAWLRFLWESFGKTAMVVPYDHAGQDRLVDLIQELQRLPAHKVPEAMGDSLADKELYILTENNGYDGFQDWLSELNRSKFHILPVYTVFNLDQVSFFGLSSSPEVAKTYLNFSAFLARLMAGEIRAGGGLSALTAGSFSTQRIAWTAKYADSETQVKNYQPYACAAALWVLYAGETLFEYCDKNIRGSWTPYKRPYWESWKEKFGEVVEDTRFDETTRHLVQQALERMAQLEGRGWTVHEEEEEEEDE